LNGKRGGGIHVLSMTFPTGLPFTIDQQPDRLVILIHSDAGQRTDLINQQSYQWICALTGTVELDFSQIPQVNSILVAWLFHLIQAGRLTSLMVSKANKFVVGQLKQYYLDRFVTISYT
jgi:ABC-type transporter Mla MlaB component